jgi:hypothetical protein
MLIKCRLTLKLQNKCRLLVEENRRKKAACGSQANLKLYFYPNHVQ